MNFSLKSLIFLDLFNHRIDLVLDQLKLTVEDILRIGNSLFYLGKLRVQMVDWFQLVCSFWVQILLFYNICVIVPLQDIWLIFRIIVRHLWNMFDFTFDIIICEKLIVWRGRSNIVVFFIIIWVSVNFIILFNNFIYASFWTDGFFRVT
jgi:hypothetical protein